VGGQSEQPDEGDRRKAAFSDALKRAAVKFGIGRYLYRLPAQWVDYDPRKKQFARTPTLPPEALPPAVKKPVGEKGKKLQPAATVRLAPAQVKAAEAAPARSGPGLPANGAELQRRLYDYDARLAKQGVCRAGDLVKHVVQAGVKAGYEADLAAWSGPAISLAVEETKVFENKARQQQTGDKKDVA